MDTDMKTNALRITLAVLVAILAVIVWTANCADSADPNSSDLHERLAAISQLDGRTDAESLNTLTKLAGDSEIRVAKSAIRMMGGRKDQAARQKLLHIVENSEVGDIRGTAAAELGNFKKTDSGLLTAMLLDDKDPKARAGAAKGLRRLHDHASKEALIKALGDRDAETRLNAHEALGALTGRWFKFDAYASEKIRTAQIAAIMKMVVRIRNPQGH